MSTKIYDGLLIKHDGFVELRNTLQQLTINTLLPEAEIRFSRVLARSVFQKVDLALWEAHKKGEACDLDVNAIFRSVRKDVRQRIDDIKATRHRDPEVDFEFSISLFPVQNGSTLCMPIVENRALLDLFKSMPGVEDFGYWNNTDKPDEVPVSEWNRRKKLWNEVFATFITPAAAGFTMQLIPEGFFTCFQLDEIEGFAPAMSDRIRYLVDLENAAAAASLLPKSDGPGGGSLSEFMRVHREYVESEECAVTSRELASKMEVLLTDNHPLSYGKARTRTPG